MNGYNILYSESKNVNLKHVLFIHGYRSIISRLARYSWCVVRTFSYNICRFVGFGGSDKPETADYTIKGFSKFILDFLQAIGIINEKICTVGHSLGGYIALQFAIENKSLVEKLVLVDPSGKLSGPTPSLSSYLDVTNEPVPALKYDNLKRVFQDMYALYSSFLLMVVGIFLDTIEKPCALMRFKTSKLCCVFESVTYLCKYNS